jgi:hypothetical protein
MQKGGDQLLARAGWTSDQDGRVGSSGSLNVGEETPHDMRRAQEHRRIGIVGVFCSEIDHSKPICYGRDATRRRDRNVRVTTTMLHDDAMTTFSDESANTAGTMATRS